MLVGWLLLRLLLQATAADDGQCLVYDTDCFGGGSNAESLVTHVASWRVTPEAASGTEISALAWHTAGALIVGTSAGVCLVCLWCVVPGWVPGTGRHTLCCVLYPDRLAARTQHHKQTPPVSCHVSDDDTQLWLPVAVAACLQERCWRCSRCGRVLRAASVCLQQER